MTSFLRGASWRAEATKVQSKYYPATSRTQNSQAPGSPRRRTQAPRGNILEGAGQRSSLHRAPLSVPEPCSSTTLEAKVILRPATNHTAGNLVRACVRAYRLAGYLYPGILAYSSVYLRYSRYLTPYLPNYSI